MDSSNIIILLAKEYIATHNISARDILDMYFEIYGDNPILINKIIER